MIVNAQATTEPAPEPRPGPTGMPCRFRPLDEVGDDQEIAGKPHSDDRPELEFEPFAIRSAVVSCGTPGAASRASSPASAARRSAVSSSSTVAAGKGRQDRLARLRDKGAAAGDDERIVARLRQIGKDRPHLGGRPKIMRRGQPLAVGIGDRRALRDAEQRVMRLVEIAVREMDVVGRDERQAVTIGQLDEARLGPRLFGRRRGASARRRGGSGKPPRVRSAPLRRLRSVLPQAACPTGPFVPPVRHISPSPAPARSHH